MQEKLSQKGVPRATELLVFTFQPIVFHHILIVCAQAGKQHGHRSQEYE